MKQKTQVYAIIRIDNFGSGIKEKVTVKSIVFDIEVAEKEVVRLNKINKDKDCEYYWQTTRLINE